MARAIPGTAEILAIYGQRPQRSTQYQASPYQKRQQVHPLATLETVIESPLTDLAVTAISRGMDEYDYYQRKSAEEDRVKAQNQGRNEQVGQLRSQIEELESKLGAIPQEALDRAMDIGQAGFTSPAPPGVEYLENAGPEPVPLGQIGMRREPVTGSPHGDFSRGVPIGGVGIPTPAGWKSPQYGDIPFSTMQQWVMDLKRLKEAEGNIAPAAKARFTPRTQQEFIQAMRAASPEERQVLMQQARNAVDMQPDSLQGAFAGTAGRKTQTAVAKATSAYDAAVAKAAADETEAGRMERETQVKEDEHTSKDAKRQADITKSRAEIKKIQAQTKKINQEAKKLEKDLAKIGRRARSGSALSKGHFTVMKMISQYPGDKISDKIVTAFADKKFISDVEKALPKNAARVYVKVFKQHRTLLNKAGDSGGQDESKILMSNQLSVKEGRKMLSKIDGLLGASQQQLIAAAATIDLDVDDEGNAKLAGEVAADMKIYLNDKRKKQEGMIDVALGGGGATADTGVDLNISKKFSRKDLVEIGAE